VIHGISVKGRGELFRCFAFSVNCQLVDRLCGLVVRVPWLQNGDVLVSCEVRTEIIYVMQKKVDRLCDLVVRVPGYRTEMYCASCEVRTEIIYLM
jgi:hypothetical protein